MAGMSKTTYIPQGHPLPGWELCWNIFLLLYFASSVFGMIAGARREYLLEESADQGESQSIQEPSAGFSLIRVSVRRCGCFITETPVQVEAWWEFSNATSWNQRMINRHPLRGSLHRHVLSVFAVWSHVGVLL